MTGIRRYRIAEPASLKRARPKRAKKAVDPIASAKTKRAQELARERAERFVLLCEHNGVPAPTRELRFRHERKWAFDFAWPDCALALESEGGAWTGGRHTRGAGYRADLEKYNAATLEGWAVLRVMSSALCTVETLNLVRQTLALRLLLCAKSPSIRAR